MDKFMRPRHRWVRLLYHAPLKTNNTSLIPAARGFPSWVNFELQAPTETTLHH